MKYAILIISLLFSGFGIGQSATITVTATACKAMNLYAFNGVSFETVAPFTADGSGLWTLEIPVGTPVFRYVGSTTSDALPLIVGADKALAISGTCGQMRNATVVASPINESYQAMKATFQQHMLDFSTATADWQKAKAAQDTVAVAKHLKTLATIDQSKRKLLTEAKAEYPILGRIVSLNTYLSFLTENNDRYQSELDYFVNTYFQFVDFTDAGYGELPWTYEGNRNFAQTLAQAVPGEQLADILQAIYNRWPAGSQARLFAMSGGFASLVQKKHPATVKLADAIVAEFKASHPGQAAQIEAQAASLRTFAIGSEAPLFAGPTPEGETISLESLRGKVVLIDFWASWCGPCRRENPNVVKMYEKYKDQGFEILAVSLDKTKDRWVKAIADDNLTWLHISDLKGWQSEYSRLYGVSSIPQTVLLDQEGKILARNLRGAELEQKVGEVLSGKK
jgi:peroxiredoxin